MMSDRHQLQMLYAEICDCIDPDQVVPSLMSKKVLNAIDRKKIQHGKQRKLSVQCLLDILIRSDPALKPMTHFKTSLQKKYPSIASKIKAEPASLLSGTSSVNRLSSRNEMIGIVEHPNKMTVSRPLCFTISDDDNMAEVVQPLFFALLDGDWPKLKALSNENIQNQNVTIAIHVRMAWIVKELKTRSTDEGVKDLVLLCNDIVRDAQVSRYPILYLGGAYTLKAWCLAFESCSYHVLGLEESADGLKRDSLSLLAQAYGYLHTLEPCIQTCWFYVIHAIVYMVNHSFGQRLTEDAACRVKRLNALSVNHFMSAESNGRLLIDGVKRLSRIHLAGSLLNFPTTSINAGVPPPTGLDAPSDENLKAAKTIIGQLRGSLSGIERRLEAYFYLLCSAAELYSKQLETAEDYLQRALDIMANISGSGPQEARYCKQWFEMQRGCFN